MDKFKISYKDLRFLVDGFEAYGFTREGAVDWCRENKSDLTPKFMSMVYDNPEGFFYYETHIKPDDELEFGALEEIASD